VDPRLDAHKRYEGIMHDMAKWISAKTWDGHEKDCPRFANDFPGQPLCECVKSTLADMYRAIRDHDIAVLHAVASDEGKLELKELMPKMMDLQAENSVLKHDLQCGNEALAWWRQQAKWLRSAMNKCPECDVTMVAGQAIQQTWTAGAPDFPGDDRGITMSPGGPGKMIDCLKCPECGYTKT
jgi:hypothetical protein